MALNFQRIERGVDEAHRTVNFIGADAHKELLCRVTWEALRKCATLPDIDAQRALALFDRFRLWIELATIKKYRSGRRESDGGIMLGPSDLI